MVIKDLGTAPAVAVRLSVLAHWGGHASLIAAGWFAYKASQFVAFGGLVYQDRAWLWLAVAVACWLISYVMVGRKPWHFFLMIH